MSSRDVSLDQIDAAIEGIFSGFVWGDTLQGYEYWLAVVKNLEAIRDAHAPRCPSCNQLLPEEPPVDLLEQTLELEDRGNERIFD